MCFTPAIYNILIFVVLSIGVEPLVVS